MPSVMTVLGPVSSGDLGVTLPHEHLFLNLMREHRATGLLHDPGLMALELNRFKEAGGRTLVECTNVGLGRDPVKLRKIAQTTSLNIVMGCGLYRDPYIDGTWANQHTVDEIAACIVRDLREGVDGTDIRAGVIGEIGADRHYVSALEERSFRAAARAHLATGVPITTHAARWPVGLAQLDILEAEGVDPRYVIIGHTDTVPDFGYHLELVKRGAWVQYDSIRGATPYDESVRLELVLQMAERGHLDRLLLSHDVCNKTHLVNGGGTGYGYILEQFLPRLTDAGLDPADLEMLTVHNPRRALEGDPARTGLS